MANWVNASIRSTDSSPPTPPSPIQGEEIANTGADLGDVLGDHLLHLFLLAS